MRGMANAQLGVEEVPMNNIRRLSPFVSTLAVPLLLNLMMASTGCTAPISTEDEATDTTLALSSTLPVKFLEVHDPSTNQTLKVLAAPDSQGNLRLRAGRMHYHVSAEDLNAVVEQLENKASFRGMSPSTVHRRVSDVHTVESEFGRPLTVTELALPPEAYTPFWQGESSSSALTGAELLGLAAILAAVVIALAGMLTVVTVVLWCDSTCLQFQQACILQGCDGVICNGEASGGGGGRDDDAEGEAQAQTSEGGGVSGGANALCEKECYGCTDG